MPGFVKGKRLGAIVTAVGLLGTANALGYSASVTNVGGTVTVSCTQATAAASGNTAFVNNGAPVPAAVTVTVGNTSSYLVQLTWTTGTQTTTDYGVEYSTTSTGPWTEETLSAACRDTSRLVYFPSSPSTTLYFRVRAKNANGYGPYSAVVSGTTLARLAFTNAATVSSYGWTGDDGTTEDPADAAAYNSGSTYVTGKVVTGATNYISITDVPVSTAPPNATYWRPIATTIYYIDSVAGNDSNNGTSAATPWQTVKKMRTKVTNPYLVGGAAPTNTLFLLKRGSTFDDVLYIQTTNGVNYTLGSYGSGAMPRIKWDTYDSSWQTRNGVIVLLTGSTLFKHIAVECGATTAPSINTIQSGVANSAMILNSCEVRGGKICGIRGDAANNWVIRNNWFVANHSAALNGLQWYGHLVEGNTFDSNGTDNTTDHHLYVSTASRLTIRGNHFVNGTGNYGTVIHGACSDIIVDQNRYSGDNNAIGVSNGYVAGISLQSPREMFAGLQITRNIIEDCGRGVGQSQGYGMIFDSLVDSIITNNTIRNVKFNGINLSASANPADDLPTSNVEISNNSFVNTSTVGFSFSVQSASTTGIRFRNNAVHSTVANGGMVTAFGSVSAAQITLTNNQYYVAAGSTQMFSWLGTNYTSLAAFQAATSKDTGSAQGDPLFTSTSGNFALQGGSPCLLTGTPVANVTIDIAGNARSGSTPSIGAYE